MALDPELIEKNTREVIARLEAESMGLADRLGAIGLVYEPIDEPAIGYRDASRPRSPPIPGFIRLGRTRERSTEGKVSKEVWVDPDRVVQFQLREQQPSPNWGPDWRPYTLLTFFADGSAIATNPSVSEESSFHSSEGKRLTIRHGPQNPTANHENHLDAVRTHALVRETKALCVDDIEVACRLGRYYHRHL